MPIFERIKNLFGGTPKDARLFEVKGMHCAACENRIKSVLTKLDGVKSVTASHQKSQVAVVASDAVSDESIKSAITKCGFEVK